MPPARPFLLFTDAPPLREGGFGCHVLGYNLLTDLDERFGMVITRRIDSRLRRTDIYHAPGARTLIFPDAPWFRPRPLRPWVEMLLFMLSVPWLAAAARRSGCQRIFALFTADPWLLPKVDLLRRMTGLPLDLYLVDDLEESARLGGHGQGVWLTRRVEAAVLRRAARVFVISEGYAEHLAAKYGQRAEWLPLLAEPAAGHTPYRPSEPDRRAVVFLGSVNALYLDSLLEMYRQITLWNQTPGLRFTLCLRLFSRTEPRDLLRQLPDQEHLEMRLDSSAAELREAMRTAWCIFLPYSFAPGLRAMVSTSFSMKFTESIAAGRPILVYGPRYASIPRYFREEGLPLCADTPSGLFKTLGQVEAWDREELIDRYRDLVKRHHSPTAIRAILLGPTDLPPAGGRDGCQGGAFPR